MFDLIVSAYLYVVTDSYFWPSMALTTMTALYLGAITYNGDGREASRGLFSTACYGIMITVATGARVTNHLGEVVNKHQPFAGLLTILLVSVFYIFGMYFGVKIVQRAVSHRH